MTTPIHSCIYIIYIGQYIIFMRDFRYYIGTLRVSQYLRSHTGTLIYIPYSWALYTTHTFPYYILLVHAVPMCVYNNAILSIRIHIDYNSTSVVVYDHCGVRRSIYIMLCVCDLQTCVIYILPIIYIILSVVPMCCVYFLLYYMRSDIIR